MSRFLLCVTMAISLWMICGANGVFAQAGVDPADSANQGSKNVTIDGISAIAALVIAAFAVDRFATALLFTLSLVPAFRKWFPETQPIPEGGDTADAATSPAAQAPESQQWGERRNRMVYFFFAAIGAGLVAWVGNIGILEVMGFKEATAPSHHGFDIALTVLILTAGADRVSALMQLSGVSAGEAAEPKPIEITGTLTIDGKTEGLLARVEGESKQAP